MHWSAATRPTRCARRAPRTPSSVFVERALLAYWVNYHLEHHLFTQLPSWKLPQAHALLQRRGVTARMEAQPGYLRVLRLAALS